MKDQTRHELLIIALTVLMGQLYIRPFDSDFRVSIGVIVFTFLLIYFEDVSILRTSTLIGGLIFLFRLCLSLGQGVYGTIGVQAHAPAIAFYICFGFLFYLLGARDKLRQPFMLFVILSFSDALSNIIEMVVRGDFFSLGSGFVLSRIVLIAIFRGVVSLLLYWLFRFLKAHALKEEKQREAEDLFVLSSKIISEKFYLSKSVEDIENAMAVSHGLYMEVKDTAFAKEHSGVLQKLIKLSTDIHEIKKDYKRIYMGLETMVPDLKRQNNMTMAEIFSIVMETNRRCEKVHEKKVYLEGRCQSQVSINNYLSVTSIINHLINNAVEAIEKEGRVFLNVLEEGNHLIIEVIDNGVGIQTDNLDYIFLPGFSTKYDHATGAMSTGVGLSQVKTLVKKRFKGNISVISNPVTGTKFQVKLPTEFL